MVLRGGSWNNNEQNVRSANRNNNDPTNSNNNNGFRCTQVSFERVVSINRTGLACCAPLSRMIGSRWTARAHGRMYSSLLSRLGAIPAEDQAA